MSRKHLVVLLVLAAIAAAVTAMEWPSSGAKLVSNFGSNVRGVPLSGDSFAAEGVIYPCDVGELVFYRGEERSPSGLPSPLGAWIALDHGDNILGLYARFEKNGFSKPPTIAEKEKAVARAGQSGWTNRDGFYFSFFDRKERRWINPSMIITPKEDTRPPVIRSVTLRSETGSSYNPAQIRSIPQGSYSVHVDAYDSVDSVQDNLAPNRIICSVNGAEVGVLSFETLISKNGHLMVYRNGLVDAGDVYGSDSGYNVGTVRFTRGQVLLLVEAKDIAENSRSVSYRLTIE